MDIYELDSYRLSDAVKFHDDLNPALWDGMQMRPEVRAALLRVADDFREFLGIDDLAVEDITVSGSNAAYSYTPHSDIDLHLIVDFSQLNPDQVYQELFNAKKYQYNDQHDIKIRGYDVELYVQDSNKPVRSLGEYSIKDDDWTRIPVRRRGNLDEKSTKSKYEKLRDLIELALKSDDLAKVKNITDTIKKYRQAGLDEGGEFGPENLAFKMLRTQGLIKRLWDHRTDLEDQRLSLAERKRKKKKSKKRFAYGSFGGWFYPGYHNDSGATADAGGDGGGGESTQEDYDPNAQPPGPEFKPEMPSGTILVNVSDTYDWYKLGQDISDLQHADPKAYGKGAPQTVLSFGSEPIEHMYKKDLDRLGMKTLDIDRRAKHKDPEAEYRMDESQDLPHVLQRFADFACTKLGIEKTPRIRIRRDPQWSKINSTFGRYNPDDHSIELATAGRHIIDVLRTLAHEMTHARQNEIVELPTDAGETGSSYEDSANAMAGRIMRYWAESEPEMFADVDLDEGWREKAGAVAAAACIAGTPGCATTDALKTVQTVGRTAQTMKDMGRAGAEEELKGAVRDALRRQRGQIPEASGYIPTEKQKNDPRFKTALTVDIRPGQTGKEANKLGLKTDSQGRPDLLMKNLANLLESVKAESSRQSLDFDSLYGRAFRITDNAGDPDAEGFSIVTPLNPGPWRSWNERPEFKDLVRRKLNDPGFLGDHKYNQIISVIQGDQFDDTKHLSEDEELTEVKMSPAEFQKFLKSPEAEGIRAGFEAELIFRDTQSDPDGSGESEPDYDADERTGSISDIIDFFTGGDNGIGGRAARRLQDELTEQFFDWVRESFHNDYFDQDRFREWADDNIWPDVDDEYREQARDNLDDPDASEKEVEQEAVTLFHDDVERDWDRSGEWYERASEELYDEYAGDADESDWLDQQGLRYMSEVANEYDLDWPYWTEGGGGDGGSRDWEEIGRSLERVTGMPVRVSRGYHSAQRKEAQYIIEPDSSLDPDDSVDMGLEIVSPPMPLPAAIDQLRRVIEWADGSGDAYTNRSTGLHMGVSLPYKGGDVDPVKLILFMGDRNILDTFDRQSNSYARSAYERLESKIRGMKNAGPKQISGIMDLMKNNLIELADRELKKGGLLGDKYVSVHPQDGYIEFRGPGGDYLATENRLDGVLENTMLRLAYAMSIAGDNSAHRQEYAKKLYKVLTGYRGAEISKGPRDTKYQTKIETEGENPFMRLFADYSAGMLSGEELKARWADTVLAAERPDVEDVPNTVPGEYEVYDKDSGTPGDRDSFTVISTFRAYNDEEAIEQAQRRWSGKGINFGVRVKVEEPRTEKPKSRRAELAKRVTRSTRDVGEQLWRVNHHSSQRWVIARSQAEAVEKAIQQDRMFDNPETRARIATDTERQQWQQDQEAQRLRQQDSDQDAAEIRGRLGVPQAAGEPIPGSTLDIQRQRQQGEFTGAWEIRDGQGRFLYRFSGIGNNQSDANRFAASWLGRNRPDLTGQEVEVVPVMR